MINQSTNQTSTSPLARSTPLFLGHCILIAELVDSVIITRSFFRFRPAGNHFIRTDITLRGNAMHVFVLISHFRGPNRQGPQQAPSVHLTIKKYFLPTSLIMAGLSSFLQPRRSPLSAQVSYLSKEEKSYCLHSIPQVLASTFSLSVMTLPMYSRWQSGSSFLLQSP
jgi:hypothetical protein